MHTIDNACTTLEAVVDETASKLTTTEMIRTDQATTAAPVVLCRPPPETVPMLPLDGEAQHLPTPL